MAIAGTQVTLNGCKSFSAGNNPTYTWTFTDGVKQTLTGIIANHTFNTAGNYPVVLTVQDSFGSDNSTTYVHILQQSSIILQCNDFYNGSVNLEATVIGHSPIEGYLVCSSNSQTGKFFNGEVGASNPTGILAMGERGSYAIQYQDNYTGAVTIFVSFSGDYYNTPTTCTIHLILFNSSQWTATDFNHEGKVDAGDFFYFVNAYIQFNQNSICNPACDLNHDGKVDASDFFTFLSDYIAYGQWYSEQER